MIENIYRLVEIYCDIVIMIFIFFFYNKDGEYGN